MKDKLLQIVQHYEISNQQRKFVEECYELIEAIVRHTIIKDMNKVFNYNFNLDVFEEHIAEEIADCLVMLKQFQYYYGIDDEQIEEVMNYKIDRQLNRIEKEDNNVKD